MYGISLVNQILKGLWKKKLRSFLGIFGIFWGTASVVLLLALGSGYYEASMKNLSSIADGAMMFMPGTTNMPYQGYPSGRQLKIQSHHIIKMGEEIKELKYVSPVVSGGTAAVHYGSFTTNRSISGVNWSYSNIWKLKDRISGRFISLFDIQKSQSVVVLGKAVEKELFKGDDAIGKQVTIWGIPFTVIGVLENGSSSGASWMAQKAYIPYTTAIEIKGDQNITMFNVFPAQQNHSAEIKQKIRTYLGSIFHFNPADKRALVSPDIEKMMEYLTVFFLVIRGFLGFCGLLTLIVGGISVSNMMFLMVTERTAEIGLRMALGAKRINILSLIMTETFVIVAIGGVSGILFSELVVHLMGLATLPDWLGYPSIDLWTIIITSGVLFFLTVCSGFFPARSAANMQPVEALCF